MERDDAEFLIADGGLHFNSHAHVERDQVLMGSIPILLDFNSHAHVERDDDMLTCVFEVINFNSHAHVERDQSKIRHPID